MVGLTAIPKDPRVSELRELFRYLVQFRTLHETDGIDEVTSSYGNVWSLWDLEYLYEQTSRLRDAQRRAITLCLVHGMLERDAAIAMGVAESNPVGMYATLGLARLLDMVDRGDLPRFSENARSIQARIAERETYLDDLAAFLRGQIKLVPGIGCWSFPTRPGAEPTVLVRSHTTSCGVMTLHPRVVLYEHSFGPMPGGCVLIHGEPGPADCINPRHARAVLSEAEKTRLRTLANRSRWRLPA